MWIAAKRVFKALISPECLAEFTWTGKGFRGRKSKTSFKPLKRIQSTVYETLKKVDKSYTSDLFRNDLVNSVLKNAYVGANKNEDK